ncbi:unnamed protein product, partial [Ixodes hexagonus]
ILQTTTKPQATSPKIGAAKARPVPVKTAENKTKGVGTTSLKQSVTKNSKASVPGVPKQLSSAATKCPALASNVEETRRKAVAVKPRPTAGKVDPPPKRLQARRPKLTPKPQESRPKPTPLKVSSSRKRSAEKRIVVKSTKKPRLSSSFVATAVVEKNPAEDKELPDAVTDEPLLDVATNEQPAGTLELLCRTPERSAVNSSMLNNVGSAGNTPFASRARRIVETPHDRPSKRTPLRTISSGELSGDSFKTAAETTQDMRDLTDSEDGCTENLNGTFTREEEDDKVASPPPNRQRRDVPTDAPSSCLRKSTRGQGGSAHKKSVSFSVPGKQDGTPKRLLPKTPRRARTIEESVTAWLEARGGSSLVKQRHSCCFEEHTPERVVRKSTPRKSGQHSVKVASATTPDVNSGTPKQSALMGNIFQAAAKEEDAIPNESSLSFVLKELRGHLTEPQNSSQDVCTRLDLLEVKCPKITDYSDYWICRSLGHRNAGNNDKALEALFLGADAAKDTNEDLLAMMKELDARMSVKENVEPKVTVVRETRRSARTARTKELLDVSMDNAFSSTLITYKVYETTSITRLRTELSADKSTPTAVMTPVRRSSRHSKRRSQVLVPPGVLYKPNPAVDDL